MMSEFETIIAANFTQRKADDMTLRVFRDPGTWTAPRVQALAGDLFRDALTALRDASSGSGE